MCVWTSTMGMFAGGLDAGFLGPQLNGSELYEDAKETLELVCGYRLASEAAMELCCLSAMSARVVAAPHLRANHPTFPVGESGGLHLSGRLKRGKDPQIGFGLIVVVLSAFRSPWGNSCRLLMLLTFCYIDKAHGVALGPFRVRGSLLFG